jgi:integrase
MRHYAPSTFTAQGDAEVWLQAERRLIERDEWTPPADRQAERLHKSTTVAEYADQWLPARRTKSGEPLRHNTRVHYAQVIDKYITPALGGIELRKLTPERVQRWYDEMDPGKPVARRHAFTLLKSMCASAAKQSPPLIHTNPCQVTMRRPKRRELQVPTVAELAVIVNAMRPEYRALVLVAAWCGLRYGEATELRRKDINLTAGTLRVERAVVKVAGGFTVGPTKTESSRRTVAIPPHLVDVLREHLAEHADPGRDGLLFPSRRGGHLSSSTLLPAFKRAAEKAGRKDLTFHDLRHLGATLAAATGATLAELMARLGHSTVDAALTYQHAAADRDAAIARALSKLAEAADT